MIGAADERHTPSTKPPGTTAPDLPPVAKRRPTRRATMLRPTRRAPTLLPFRRAPMLRSTSRSPTRRPTSRSPSAGQPAERQRSGHPAGHQRAGQPCQISPQGRSRSAPHLLTRYPNTAKNPPVGSEIRKMHMRERVYSLQTGYATK